MCDKFGTSILAEENCLLLVHHNGPHTYAIGGPGIQHAQIMSEIQQQLTQNELLIDDALEMAQKLAIHHIVTRLLSKPTQ